MGFELTWLSLEKNSFTGARRLRLRWLSPSIAGERPRAVFPPLYQTQVALGRQNARVFRANFHKGFAVVPPRKTIDGVCAVQRKSVRIRRGVPKVLETDGRFLLPFRPQ